MRRRGACAAIALLALALGAASCKPSSLTPFGIGTREPEAVESLFSGAWAGNTGSGGTITFTVASGTVTDIRIVHVTSDCTATFELSEKAPSIEGDAFAYDNTFVGQGVIHVEGRFLSPEICSGSYFFQGRPASTCANMIDGNDTFTALKTP